MSPGDSSHVPLTIMAFCGAVTSGASLGTPKPLVDETEFAAVRLLAPLGYGLNAELGAVSAEGIDELLRAANQPARRRNILIASLLRRSIPV